MRISVVLNFTGAILRDTKFCHAKAGLQRRWTIFLVMLSWLLGGISGFFSSFAGAMVSILILIGDHFLYKIAGWASLIVLFVYLRVIISFGIQASVATVAGGFAVAIGGILAFAIASFVGGEFAIAIAGVFAIAATLTIAATFAVAVAVAFAIARGLAVIGVFLFGLAFPIFGPFTIVASVSKGYAVAFAGGFTVVFFLVGIYIAFAALKGED